MDMIYVANYIFAIFSIIFFVLALYGFLKKRIYALGRWYYRGSCPCQYWQVVIGYLLFGVVLTHLRMVYLG
jgi:hypothetical protein